MFFSNKIMYSINDLAPYIADEISNGNKVRLTVTGNSMYPLLRNKRDAVTLEKTDMPKKYDIVFYRRPNGQYVLHRVLNVYKNHLIIAGDGETEREYAVPVSAVMARVTSVIRRNSDGDREYNLNELWYKVYVRLWNFLFPLRHVIIWCRIKIGRLINGKKGKK